MNEPAEYTVVHRVIQRMTVKAQSKEQAIGLAMAASDAEWRTVRSDYETYDPVRRAERPKNPILDEGPWCSTSDE